MSNVSVGSADAAFVTTATDVLNEYNRRGNMYDAKLQFHKLLDDLQSPAVCDRIRRARMGTTQTVQSFEKEHLESYVVFQLAMSMSPLAFRSVLSGTVDERHLVFCHWPGPGVYAVGVAVDGRGGKFLSAREIETLAQGVERYSAGYDTLKTAPPAANRGLEAGCQQFNDPEQQRVLVFAERLRERARLLMTVDPTGNVVQVQSSLYIGRSDKLENRTKDYQVPVRLGGINKLLVLTLNVLETMNLQSSLHARPVIRIWERHQLPFAERLVATPAESLVAQNSFNAKEASGRAICMAIQTELMAAKVQVFSIRPFLRQHLRDVKTELEARLKFIDGLKWLSRSTLKQKAIKTKEQLEAFLALKPMAWTTAVSMLRSKAERLDKQWDTLLRLKVQMNSIMDLQRAMLPPSEASRL
ncbi:uncharacterized protein MAM_04993 [Metarhizium album ARSEF 1941]|uniref:Uncharacterized protein n=1 Tax=Metarhizium album (strain ARSEF 1941) TaxID=1081103 RepID=A0A0B2WMU9_METAS|nr:uncharacterized protein MAM_04993 [Metarhizium album ARSEF 1941]KHN97396.1 hypothetical protein MAM_04993 [Metarhizium album ARSEF 1941]